MKERPILFSAPMVRALLDGCKTQTRRAIKLPHINPLGKWEAMPWGGPDGGKTREGKTVPVTMAIGHTRTGDILGCPHGQPGDRLWVRETWYCDDYRVQSGPYLLPPDQTASAMRDNGTLVYRADDPAPYEQEQPVWRPSIHMPRWASRMTLEITDVRVERLQDISEVDAVAEGCVHYEPANHLSHGGWSHDKRYVHKTATESYVTLWEQINGPGSWNVNPWVWVIEFKVITP
ncbi:MAG TPA: hypothetical protein VE934_12195 [Polaromonas sp.]|uniref:hypothetical protein n=1 Tax=Polaromonas sp. TaxID=1869339 RepID=UPI002D6E429C|nr:hypothetical protein [Polaromonas sp.]HYW57717.1 hypothetical protein [Polaromonas sp.]